MVARGGRSGRAVVGRSLGVGLLVISLVAAGCSGGSSSVTVSVPDIVFGPESNVDSSLTPSADGFTFANFTAGQLPDLSFDANELVAMFGDTPEICAEGAADSCTLSAEAAAWAQMVNDARNSGHCEGFAVMAMERWDTDDQPPTGQLQFTQDVVESIMRGFATQFIGEVRAEAAAWRKKSPRDIVAAVTDSLRDGKPDFVLGVYSDVGGHAVLPYKVAYHDDTHARISVYDSNWPGQERFVDVDLDADTWRFAFDVPDIADGGAWTGGKGRIDLASLESRLGGSCPFCDDGAVERATVLVIRSAAPGWSVTVDGRSVTADNLVTDGVTASPTRAGLVGVEEYLVVVDPAAVEEGVSVAVPGSAVVHGVTPAGVIRADSRSQGATFGITDRAVSSSTAGATVRLAAGDLAGSASGATSTVSLGDGELRLAATAADGTLAEFVVDDAAGAARLVAQTGANLPSGTSSVVAVDGRTAGADIIRTFDDGTSTTERSEDDLALTPVAVPLEIGLKGSVDATRLEIPGKKLRIVPGSSLEGDGDDDAGAGGGSNDQGGGNGGNSETIDQSGSNGKMDIAMSWEDIGWNALQMVNVYECGETQPRLHIHVNNADARVTVEVRNFPNSSGGTDPTMTFDGDSVTLTFPKISIDKSYDIKIVASTAVDGNVAVKARVRYARPGCSDK